MNFDNPQVLSSLACASDAHQFNSSASKDKEPARDSRIGKRFPAGSFKAAFVLESALGRSKIRHDSDDMVEPDHGFPTRQLAQETSV